MISNTMRRMRIVVKLFGPEAKAAGARELVVEVAAGDASVGAVREAVLGACPALADLLPGCRVAVNCEFADETAAVSSGDEVALIGRVSGG